MKVHIIFFYSLLFLSCSSNQQSKTINDTLNKDTLAPDGTVTDTSNLPAIKQEPHAIKTFKGLYILGDEVSTFRDCESNKLYWVEDENKKLSGAYTKAAGFLSYPYESVYVEVKGYLKGKSDVGYAQEYENVLVVTNLTSAKQKNFSTNCFTYEYIALGNEPFWSLEIIPSEKIIAMKDAGNEKTYVFPYRKPTPSDSTATYQSTNGKKQTLLVIIKKEQCSDGMSDRKYNYSVQVTLNGTLFQGCAIRMGEKVSMDH